jgi:hypothetical protein
MQAHQQSSRKPMLLPKRLTIVLRLNYTSYPNQFVMLIVSKPPLANALHSHPASFFKPPPHLPPILDKHDRL